MPRWVILLADGLISSFSFSTSILLVTQREINELFTLKEVLFICALYSLTSVIVFKAMHLHKGLIRYSNIHDTSRIFASVFISSISFLLISSFLYQQSFLANLSDKKIVSILPKILFLNFFVTSTFLILFRASIKAMYYYLKTITKTSKKNVIIFGTDRNAIFMKKAIDAVDDFNVVGFLNMAKTRTNAYIEQVPVYNLSQLKEVRNKKGIESLILMNEQLASKDKQEIINACLALNVHILTAPPSTQWLYGKINPAQIKQLNIEDLLQREPIVIDSSKISEDLCGKRVLITGAAGSIGSEIVRQVMSFKPAVVILVDQAESPLHDVQLEMDEEFPAIKKVIHICSIQNRTRMESIFRDYSPQVVYHAAAYKHVPMMELHPQEAVFTNIMGTRILADLSIEYGAEKFVMISTDKAVNPTNVMGASKRIAEMYVQSRNSGIESFIKDDFLFSRNASSGPVKTRFITTRFGNVLDSNGSVIPRFRSQIRKGGPVTVTHPDITRYFMTIKEAVQLVLEAGTMGKGGEIFVFDMGKPIKIRELAMTMIRLANLEPDKDIMIKFTGLRPGEKLYEEMLNENEKTLPTHHNKIRIAKVIAKNPAKVASEIQDLQDMAASASAFKLVKKMKEIVPEYKSNNSKFEILDTPTAAPEISMMEQAKMN
jgi:FlaA1/EpsC-like NDP-sugar epimerase